jgi:hypothetical protein
MNQKHKFTTFVERLTVEGGPQHKMFLEDNSNTIEQLESGATPGAPKKAGQSILKSHAYITMQASKEHELGSDF